jgi:hypothetical protein
MKHWKMPQKMASPPPKRGSGVFPVIFCFRCEAPTLVMVRQEGSPFSGESYEERNDRQQVYVVLQSESPTWNGSRMRLNFCGKCAEAFGPHEYGMVIPFVISGIEKTLREKGRGREDIQSVIREYGACKPVRTESFAEAHAAVRAMMEERRHIAERAIRDGIEKEREIRKVLGGAMENGNGE